ncbi:hypothetical protein [Oleispirillum naphthae]|uniref:hypothetical protein n=1 Tax=Oleispirillum naphthae TaxID=2838853 RepID=UPI0030824342
MTLGRVFGWVLIVMAALTASAEAVVALGTGEYDSIATVDIWTLLTGRSPEFAATAHAGWSDALGAMLLAWPAWTVIGAFGCALIFACRPRRKRAEYREASMRFSLH